MKQVKFEFGSISQQIPNLVKELEDLQRVENKLTQKQTISFLALCQKQTQIRSLKRILLQSNPQQIWQILTLGEFTRFINEYFGPKLYLSESVTSRWFINKLLEERKAINESFQVTSGLAENLRQIHENAILSLNFEDFIKQKLPNSLNYDQVEVIKKYNIYLKEKGITDQSLLYEEALKLLKKPALNLKFFLSGWNFLIIYGFFSFQPIEIELILSLSQSIKNSYLLLDSAELLGCSLDSSNSDDHSSESLKELQLRFKEENFKVLIEKEDRSKNASGATAKTAPQKNSPDKLDPDDHICQRCHRLRIFQSSNRASEVQTIAKFIRAYLKQNLTKKQVKIGVAFPRLDKYASLVNIFFSKYKIPYQIALGWSLLSHPLGQLISLILKFPAQNFSSSALLKILRHPLVHFEPELSSLSIKEMFSRSNSLQNFISPENLDRLIKSNFNISQINKICIKCNIIGGADFMQDWCKPVIEAINATSFATVKREKNNPASKNISYLALLGLFKLHKSFKNLYESKDITKFSWQLMEILRQLGILKSIQAKADNDFEHTKKLALFEEKNISAGEAFNVLVNILENLQNILPKFEVRQDFSDFSKIILELMSVRQIHGFSSLTPVEVISFYDLESITYPVLFIGGLIEGEFPTNPNSRLKYSSEQFHYVAKARHLLNNAIVNSKAEKIFLSFPSADQQRTLFPSFLLTEVSRKYRAVAPQAKDIQKAGAIFSELFNDSSENVAHISEYFENISSSNATSSTTSYNEMYNNLKLIYKRLVSLADSTSLGSYEGILNWKENLDLLEKKEKNTFSVTFLESYAKCPAYAFFEKIIKVQKQKEAQMELEPAKRGEIIHKILQVFTQRREESRAVAPQAKKIQEKSTSEKISSAQFWFQLMSESAEDVLNYYLPSSSKTNFANKIWIYNLLAGLKNEKVYKPGILKLFLQNEENLLKAGFHTIELEAPFKFQNQLNLNQNSKNSFPALEIVDNLFLEGVIDRIDLSQVPGTTPILAIYDYKSGKVPTWGMIQKGLNFQLLIYFLAADLILKHKYIDKLDLDTLEKAAAYYEITTQQAKIKTSLGHPKFKGIWEIQDSRIFKSMESKNITDDETIKDLKSRIEKLVLSYRSGHLHTTLADPGTACFKDFQTGFSGCPYRPACRANYEKMQSLYTLLDDNLFYKPGW